MIDNSVLYSIYIGVTLTFITPMVLMFMGIAFKKLRIAPIFMGMLVYFIATYLIHLPLILGLQLTGFYDAIQNNPFLFPVISSFLLAFSLGFGRLLGWFPIKKNHDFKGAISLGFGMGMLDCIMVAGINMVTTMGMAKAYNAGALQSAMAGVDAELLQTIITSLTETPGYLYVVSSVERVVLLLVEMVLAVLLYKAWQKQKLWKGMVITVGIQWFILASVGLLSSMNIILGTIYLVLWAVVGVYFLYKVWKLEKFEKQDSVTEVMENTVE